MMPRMRIWIALLLPGWLAGQEVIGLGALYEERVVRERCDGLVLSADLAADGMLAACGLLIQWLNHARSDALAQAGVDEFEGGLTVDDRRFREDVLFTPVWGGGRSRLEGQLATLLADREVGSELLGVSAMSGVASRLWGAHQGHVQGFSPLPGGWFPRAGTGLVRRLKPGLVARCAFLVSGGKSQEEREGEWRAILSAMEGWSVKVVRRGVSSPLSSAVYSRMTMVVSGDAKRWRSVGDLAGLLTDCYRDAASDKVFARYVLADRHDRFAMRRVRLWLSLLKEAASIAERNGGRAIEDGLEKKHMLYLLRPPFVFMEGVEPAERALTAFVRVDEREVSGGWKLVR